MDNVNSTTTQPQQAQIIQQLMAQGVKFHQGGQLDLASKAYQNVLKMNENHVDAIHLLGVIAYQIGSFDESKILIEQAITLNPNQAIFYNNLGNTLKELKAYTEAYKAYESAIKISPQYDKAYFNQGILQVILNNYDSAKELYQKAININPRYEEALNNLGGLYEKENNYQQAKETYLQAVQANPRFAQGYYNLGVVERKLSHFKEALEYEFKALGINPNMPEAKNNIGVTYIALQNYPEAIRFLTAALETKPDYPDAHLNLGLCYFFTGFYSKAKSHFDSANRYASETWEHYCNAKNYSIFMSMHLCLWDNIEEDIQSLMKLAHKRWLNNEPANIEPFSLQALPNTSNFHLKAAKEKSAIARAQSRFTYQHQFGIRPKKIKIGYLSTNFNEHPIGFLLKDSLKHHNKNQFETYVFHSSHKIDHYTALIKNSVDHFIDLTDMKEKDAAACIHDLGIHILIDLGGHTKDNKLSILAYQPAAIQCHLLGYAGSIGADFIQYFITSEHIIPNKTTIKSHFTEKLALTHDWFSTPVIPKQACPKTRYDYQLPENAFVYACFNQNYRMDKTCFDDWMEILSKTDNSVLWLFSNSEETQHQLTTIAKAHNISPDRLIFTEDFVLTNHWHHTLADLYLDTYILSSGTATLINLASSKPILSLQGDTPESRVSSSILKSSKLEDLIAIDRTDYIQKAIHLCQSPVSYEAITQPINDAIEHSNLFNPQHYIAHLEDLYHQMWDNGDKPVTINVQTDNHE